MNPFLRVLRASAIVAALTAAGCGSKPDVCSAPQGSGSAAKALAADETSFALAFYPPAAAAAGTGQNVILSPYSASSALTLLDVGAAGQTAAQIEAVLRLSGSAAATAPAYAALACANETDGLSNDNQLAIANAVWGQKGVAFVPSFLSTLANGYSAPLRQIDFKDDAGGATSAIDAWVSDRTQGKIPSLFMPGDVDASTRLVVVNAIYFNGTWANGFDPSATRMSPFTLADGSMVDVPTMNGTVSLKG